MALGINNQNLLQNVQFQQFVNFAETQINAGKQKAIARIDPGEIGGIASRTIKPGSGDWVGIGAGRLASLKRANNATRDAFRQAVADMFGGENHIPDSVKDAMKLKDYGKGKPLTARRIMAVKEAIVQALETSAGKELSPKDANRALTNAFLGDEPISQSGMPLEFAVAMRKMINGLHERYFGGPPAQEPTLRDFVGRFFMTTIESMRVAANKEGRRITLDELMAAAKPFYESYAVEKMLADTMPDILGEMGMEDSKEFLNVHSFLKRNPDVLDELINCKSRDEVKSCIERNRDALKANMQLVAETRTCKEQYFSMVDDSLEKAVGMKWGIAEREKSTINFKNHLFLTSILNNECEDEKRPGFNLADEFKKRVDKLVADYAERFQEAEQCARNGEISDDLAKHWKEETLTFANPKTFFPGKIVAAAKNLDGQELLRALDPSNDSATALKAVSDFARKLEAEGVKIVGGEKEWQDAGVDGREPIKQRVIEVLVEKNPGLKDALLSRRLELRSCYRQLVPEKKDQAGYNLAELLFERNNFEYLGFPHEDFTVGVKESTTASPMQSGKLVEMNAGTAAKYVEDAVTATGVNLTDAQRSQAADYLVRYGGDMFEQNARMLARFVVNLKLSEESAQGDDMLAKDMASTIRTWRNFGFDEPGMDSLRKAVCDQANVLLSESMADANNFNAGDPDIYLTLKTDSNRAHFTVNGQSIVCNSGDNGAPLVGAVKQALPPGKARKAVSSLLNQDTLRVVSFLQNRISYPAGPGQAQDVDAWKLPGAEKLANRDMKSGLYLQTLNGKTIPTYDLQVSEDGTTATIITTYDCEISTGDGSSEKPGFDRMTVQTKLTIDIASEEPKVIDAAIAQKLG